jgi:hypothetical protein
MVRQAPGLAEQAREPCRATAQLSAHARALSSMDRSRVGVGGHRRSGGCSTSRGSVRAFWSRHSFTASVVAGVLVLLLTILIVDRVSRIRQLSNQARAIAAQAAVIVAQAGRAADAITRSSPSKNDREEASQELRTYMQILLTSAPVLIEGKTSRRF